MITAGEGKYRVWLKQEDLGNDLLYILGGGERPHVGGVVVKVPGTGCGTSGRTGDGIGDGTGGGTGDETGDGTGNAAGEKTKVLKLENHYDHLVLEPLAEAACRKYNKTVVVVGGIHVDNASKDEIDKLIANCEELKKCI